VVYKSCLTVDHTDGLNGLVNINSRWNLKIPKYPTRAYIADIICKDRLRIACVQMLPILRTAPKIAYYDNCVANLLAAVKRQATAVVGPNSDMLDQLECFVNTRIVPEWEDLLIDFDYSFNVWYNHLTTNQQLDMDKVDTGNLQNRFVKIFCKAEKQLIENGEWPKNRAISALCDEHKYVMGPIIYALEQYFKQWFGYAGGCTWDDLGSEYAQWQREGFTLNFQTDISGLDRSVVLRIIQIIKSKVFDIIRNKVKHVTLDDFDHHAYPTWTKITTTFYGKDEIIDLGTIQLLGLVYSGAMYTTWFNTIITIIVTRFVYEHFLGYTKQDYRLKAKGDDGQSIVQGGTDPLPIISIFNKCFIRAKYTKHHYAPRYLKHGLGLTLKYLSVSTRLDDLDFCSTNCFYCPQCDQYRLTRKIDRFLYLTPWTDSIHNMKRKDQLAYMENLYISNLRWMAGLPIFEALNDQLHTGVQSDYSLCGKQKKKLILTKLEQDWYDKLFDHEHVVRVADLQQKFGKNLAYSMISQVSGVQRCCIDSYYDWIKCKMGLTKYDITTIHQDIYNQVNGVYDSPLLSLGLQNLELYKATLLN
jgi:hypothetical protein